MTSFGVTIDFNAEKLFTRSRKILLFRTLTFEGRLSRRKQYEYSWIRPWYE